MKPNSISILLALAVSLLALPMSAATPVAKGDQDQSAKLVAVLNNQAATQKEKADACRELARVGGKGAVPALSALLADENLSHMARYGLETIQDSSVDKAFRNALVTLHGRQLVGVIGSVGVRRDTGAVKALAGLLQDADPEVVQASARALGRIGNGAAGKALESALAGGSVANQPSVCEGLLRYAEQAPKSRALKVYERLGQPSLPHQVRTAAVRGNIVLRGGDGIKTLADSLAATDSAVFSGGLRAAQELALPEVTGVLSQALTKVSADRQIAIIAVLSRRKDPSVAAALVPLTARGDKATRIAAIRGLAVTGDAAAVPQLTALLSDGDKEVAAAAKESLGGLPGPQADEAVLKMLQQSDSRQKMQAMELIARRRMTVAAPELLKAATDGDAQVRHTAVRQLGELGGADAFPQILQLLLKSRADDDLEATESALGVAAQRLNDPDKCVTTLENAMAGAAPAQKRALLRVISTIGGRNALAAVQAAIKASDPELHQTAVRVLASWPTTEAATSLLEIIRTTTEPTEKMICLRGYFGLAGQGGGNKQEGLRMCQQAADLLTRDEEKKLLLGTLGELQIPGCLDLAVKYLDDANCKEEAGIAVVAVAEKVLQGRNADKSAARTVGPLEKAAQATTNPDRAKRAQTLLEQARTLAKTAK